MDAKLEGLIKSLVLFGKKHKSLIYPIVALLLTMGAAYEGINATKKLINSTVKQIKEFLPKKRIYRQSIKTLNLIKFKDKLLSDTPKIAVNFVSMLKQITRQRFIAGALSACLIFGFFPSAVFAAEEVNPVPTDTAIDMIEDISGTDTCVCAILCTENVANMDCPLCSAPKADLKLCLGKAAEEQTEQKKEEAPPSDESTDKIPTEATARNTANVATIGATAYPSLGDAVKAATPGDKITLTADDTTSSQMIEISKNLSIELDGHSLPSTTFKLTAGNISISDSKGTGEIGKKITSDGISIDGATVTLNNIRVFSGNGNAKAIRLLSGALTVNGGVYTGQGSNGSDAIFVTSGTLTINDGVFQSVNYGCGLSYSGSPENLKIKKGTFIGGNRQGGFWLISSSISSSIKTKEDVENTFLKDSTGSFVVLADGDEFDRDNVVIGSGLFTSDGFKEPENGSTDKDNPAVLSPSSGDSVTLAPQILGGSGDTSTLEYEWSKDNTVLNGETSPTHTITNYNPANDDGAYSVTIKDPALPDAPIDIFWQVDGSGGSGDNPDPPPTVGGVTIKVNGGAEVNSTDLATAVTASNVSAADIKSLEIITGNVIEADWLAIKAIAPKLQTLTIHEAVNVADIPDGERKSTGSIFPTTITSIDIPQSIKIGANAFYNCKLLSTITLPNVTELASASFYGCNALTTVTLDSLVKIGGKSADDRTGYGSFSNCKALTSVSLPKLTVASISAFSSCSALTEINAPLLTTIEDGAFSSTAFTSVNFPNVKTIGKSAFLYCEKLVEATFASLTETTGGFNGCIALERFTAPKLSIIGKNMFDSCSVLTEVNAEAVTKIEGSSFLDCINFEAPNFPNVREIGNGAFQGCKSLIDLSFPKVEILGDNVFYSTDIYEKNEDGKYVVVGSNVPEKLTQLSLPMITSIGKTVFTEHLDTLYLPATPPTATSSTFKSTGTIYFIDENSDPLTGDALTTAHDNYKAVNDGNTTDVMWYKWALGAPEAQWKSADETSKGIGTLYDSLKAVSKIGGKVTVLMDYNYGEGTLPLEFTAVDNKNEIGLTEDVTLDLAGHSLSFPKMQNQPFRFESNTGKFTVTDTGKTGKITTKSNAVFMCLDNAKFEITGGTYSVDNADPFGAVSYFTEDTTADVLRAGLKRIVPSGYLFDPADIIVEDYDYTASTATTVKIVPDVMAPMPQNVKVTRTDNYKRPIISWDAVEGGSPEYTVTLYSVTADEATKTTNTLTEISKATTAKTSLTWQTDLTEGTRYVFGITAKVTDKEFASKEAISRVYNCAANPIAPGGKIEKPTSQENVDSVFGEGNATLEGDKIIINNDITVEGTITIDPNVTIDLNDNTLTGKDGVDPVISVTSPANVTITGPGSIIGGNGTDDNLNGGNAINGDDSSIDESNVTINGGANVTGGNGTGTGNGGDGIDLGGSSGNITVDKGTVTGGTGTTGGNGATTGIGDITVNTGGAVSGGAGTTGGNGATTGAGDITVNTGGAVSGGNGTNGSGDNSTGGTGGIGTITGTGNTTVNGTVTGGNGGDNNGTGNGGNGGVGANEDEEIKGNGTITGGNGGNITEGGTGNVGSGGNAITGGGTFPSGNPKPGGDGVNATQKVESVSGAPTVTVPPQDLINGAVTEDDRKDNTITKIDVTLTVEKKEPSTTDKDKVIEEVKDGQEVGIYLDITLEKVLTKNNTAQPSEKVTEATQPITITVEIPANMRGGSNYTIIRVHGSSVDTIEPTQITETTLTFKTDKFSTYAIAYTPGEVTTPDNNTPPPYYGNTTGGSSSAPTEQEPNLPSEGKVDISGSADSKGNVTIAITDKAISDAIKNAEDNALKNGNTNAKFTLSLNSNAGSSKSNSVTVNLPKSAQEKIIASSISNTVIAVSNPQIKVSLSLATVKEIYRQAKADVNITATKLGNNKLKGDAKAAIANRPLFELKLSYGKDKQLVTLGANSIILTIPYSLQKGELSGGLIAAFVTNDKNVSYINHSSYDKNDKVMRFAISRPSSCGISYKSPTAFKDITNHPLKEDIDFAAARGLINETKDNFYPNGPITRGVFITALGKLANINVSNYKAVKLTDIKAEDYYAPYAQWASEKGILKEGTTFGPYVAMSRQTMAEIICNYTKAIGFDLPLMHTENFFDDKQAIAYNATDSIKQLQMAGILLGKDENKFDPYGTVTRAEFFAILHRLQDLILEESTAQGFKQNDIGSQMYFENGNPIKNQTKYINNKAYTFNSFGITTDHIQKETISNSTSGNADVSNSAAIRYVVKSGDSFWKISKEHNVNINTLVKANKMTTTSAIYPGDVLTIPM